MITSDASECRHVRTAGRIWRFVLCAKGTSPQESSSTEIPGKIIYSQPRQEALFDIGGFARKDDVNTDRVIIVLMVFKA
jgi:hypothetical protein